MASVIAFIAVVAARRERGDGGPASVFERSDNFPGYPDYGLAPRVRALCEKYGLPYNTGSFWQQYGSVLGAITRLALPSSPATAPAAA